MVLNNDNDETRKMVEHCYQKNRVVLNPIIDWTDEEVWEYIHKYNLPYNPLYDKGYKRIGCIGCPMSSKAREELERYPKIKRLYLRAFEKMLDRYEKKPMWKGANDVYDWWIRGQDYPSKIQTKLETD